MSRSGCIDLTGNVQSSHTPCSSKTNTYCCPDEYECRRNGLCTLLPPSDRITILPTASNHTLYSNEIYGKGVIWATLPSCSSSSWSNCGFANLECSNNRFSGFIPASGSPSPCLDKLSFEPLDNSIASKDWLDCSFPFGRNVPRKSNCSQAEKTLRALENVSTDYLLSPIAQAPNRPKRQWPDPEDSYTTTSISKVQTSSFEYTSGAFPSASVTALSEPHRGGFGPKSSITLGLHQQEQQKVVKHGLPTQTLVLIILTIVITGVLIPCWVLAQTRKIRGKREAVRRRASLMSLEEVYVGPELDEVYLSPERRNEGGARVDEEVPPPYKARESALEPPPPCYSLDSPTLSPGTLNNTMDGTGTGTGADGATLAEPVAPDIPDGERNGMETGPGPDGRYVLPQERRV